MLRPHLFLLAAFCAMLIAPTAAKESPRPVRALLITGGCCHDYNNQKDILTKGISARSAGAGGIEWTIEHEGTKREHRHSIYSKPDWWKGYDVIVHDECFGFVDDDAFVDGIVKAHADARLPIVAIHCSAHSYRKAKTRTWSEMLGIRSEAHGPRNDIAVTYAKSDHPITRGLASWTSPKDELYNNIKVYEKTAPLATGKQGDAEAIVAWTNDFNGVRVFVTTLGHTNETVSDPNYLDLVTRGLLWSVGKLEDEAKPAGN
jgi:type 1 glutamine amidotransferase